jgi:methionine-rich copper-binding protein CopC
MRKILLAMAVLLALPDVAFAHSALVKSVPGSRAVLTRSPDRVTLCFNEAIELKFSSIKVEDAKKAAVAVGEVKTGETPQCLEAGLPALGAGGYTVRYRVLSKDGHTIDYGYQFTIKAERAQP